MLLPEILQVHFRVHRTFLIDRLACQTLGPAPLDGVDEILHLVIRETILAQDRDTPQGLW